MYGRDLAMNQPGTVQLAQDAKDPPRAVNILHVVFLGRRSDFTQVGDPSAKVINIGHTKFHPSLVGRCQQVQHGIGRATHGDVQGYGVVESLAVGDGAGQGPFVTLLIPASR